MEIHNALPALSETPQDARGDWGRDQADEVVYRLGLACNPPPGLPESLSVGDTTIDFVVGPVRAQQTEMRQRFGLPIVFDKSMQRLDFGAGEVIAVVSIQESPVPDDLEAGFARWRARALAAAGLLASVLDERVVGRELFEDALFLRNGAFVGAADLRAMVRSFLPFNVNESDLEALEQLAGISADESSRVARAARLYLRAALEGPTADAYAMLWVAAECFSQHRSPSRKDIEKSLSDAGLDPSGLPVSIGRLIELRGKIQHHGVEADDRLKTAFYEMEAVVRTLIRQEAKIRGGWWFAPDNAMGFGAPFDAWIAEHHDRGETIWHSEGLPDPEPPTPLHLPRKIAKPDQDPRLELDAAVGELSPLIAAIVLDAIEWIEPDMRLKVLAGRPPGAPEDSEMGANADRIWLAEERLDAETVSNDPNLFAALVWDLVPLVGFASAQRNGIPSRNEGVIVVQAIGSWLQYLRLVRYGEFPVETLSIPASDDPISMGKLCGWAAAGETRARDSIDAMATPQRKLAKDVLKALEDLHPAVPIDLLDGLGESARKG